MATGLVMLACTLSQPTPTPSQEAIEAQRAVDAMTALWQDLSFPIPAEEEEMLLEYDCGVVF